jgi:hypothetical protein
MESEKLIGRLGKVRAIKFETITSSKEDFWIKSRAPPGLRQLRFAQP